MIAFVWQDVTHVSDNRHHGGGILVIAADLDAARKLIREQVDAACGALDDEPDRALELTGVVEPGVIVFPDVGCC